MDRDGFTSQRQTAQMEENESEESCMAEKNHRVSEAQLQVNIRTFDTTENFAAGPEGKAGIVHFLLSHQHLHPTAC